MSRKNYTSGTRSASVGRSSRLRCERLEDRNLLAVLSFIGGVDTTIAASAPNQSGGWSNTLGVAATASGQIEQALLKFPTLVGTGADQIPAGSTINRASLTFWVATPADSSGTIRIHQMFVNWDPTTATWDSFGGSGGVSENGVTARATADGYLSSSTAAGYQIISGLTNAVQTWVDGGANDGWVIVAASPIAGWSAASSESAGFPSQPVLTVDFTAPQSTGNLSYVDLVGPPPAVTSLAWFTWADTLRNDRLARVPDDRALTFYFAQNGDDTTGTGSIDSPWKTLAKAQAVMDETAGDVRLSFRDGDTWYEADALTVDRNNVTVDDYGAGPKPVFSRFVYQFTNGWTSDGGYLYQRPMANSVGWVLETANPLTNIYYRAASSAEVARHPYSFYYDAAGSDPSSNGVATLYVNSAGDPDTLPGGLAACPGDSVGWTVNVADNVRMQNLVIEGSACSAVGDDGLEIFQQGNYEEFVGVGLEVYYTGNHGIGQIGVGTGSHSAVTLVDCTSGLDVNRFGNGQSGAGDATAFVSYSSDGGNEYIQYQCVAAYGVLPSADWLATPGLAHGEAFYTHTDGGSATNDLIICEQTSSIGSANPFASLNSLNNLPVANTLDQVRGYIVEDRGPVGSAICLPNTVVVNGVYGVGTPPPAASPAYGMIVRFPPSLPAGGWLINTTLALNAINQDQYVVQVFNAFLNESHMINCEVDVYNTFLPITFSTGDPTTVCPDATLTNTIISLDSPSLTYLDYVNDAAHLEHNAYYLPFADPVYGSYSGDPGAVTLTSRFAAGTVPSASSPLYNAGLADGLEYDQNGNPRYGINTIGPLTEPVTQVQSVVVNDGSAQRSEVRSLTVTFSSAVSFAGGAGSAAAAFNLQNLKTGNVVALAAAVATDAVGRTVVTLSFSGAETDPVSALNGVAPSLANGRYQLTIVGGMVTGTNGVALDGSGAGIPGSNYVSPSDVLGGDGLRLYRLFGDATGDGVVDAQDLGQFRATFNSTVGSSAYLAYFDADNSGAIDASDLGQFRQEMNATVFPIAEVQSVVVNDGSAQRSEVRSISVTFSGQVSFSGSPVSAFSLMHVETSKAVDLAAAVTSDSLDRTVVTLTFSGSETDPVSASNGGAPSLADGSYQLTIFGAMITGANGLLLDGADTDSPGSNYVSPTSAGGNGTNPLGIFRLFGDANGDGTVDAQDLGVFRSALNSTVASSLYLAYLDADNNGAIDAQDLGQFRSRMNARVD